MVGERKDGDRWVPDEDNGWMDGWMDGWVERGRSGEWDVGLA